MSTGAITIGDHASLEDLEQSVRHGVVAEVGYGVGHAGRSVSPGLSAPGRIRTCDRRIRSPMLYPAELRAPTEVSPHEHDLRRHEHLVDELCAESRDDHRRRGDRGYAEAPELAVAQTGKKF